MNASDEFWFCPTCQRMLVDQGSLELLSAKFKCMKPFTYTRMVIPSSEPDAAGVPQAVPPPIVSNPKSTAFELPQWDPKTLPKDAFSLIVGRRNAGKTTLMRDLLRNKSCRSHVVFDATGDCNGTYRDLSNVIWHDHYDEQSFADILAHQKKLTNATGSTAIVLDDVVMDFKKDKSFNFIAKMGQTVNLLSLVAVQTAFGVPLELRGNVDCLFVFQTRSREERERLWKTYFSMFPTISAFNQVMDILEPHMCLVLDTRKYAESNHGLFYYTAQVA